MHGSRDICCTIIRGLVTGHVMTWFSGAVDSTQAATPLPDLTVGRRRAGQRDIHEPPWMSGARAMTSADCPTRSIRAGRFDETGFLTWVLFSPQIVWYVY